MRGTHPGAPNPDAIPEPLWSRIRGQAAGSGYGLIHTRALATLMNEQARVLVLAHLEPWPFDQEHIPGSVRFAPRRSRLSRLLGKRAFTALLGPDPDRPLVFSCSGPSCARCRAAARLAVRLGYHNVLLHPAGLDGWKRSGLGVEATQPPLI